MVHPVFWSPFCRRLYVVLHSVRSQSSILTHVPRVTFLAELILWNDMLYIWFTPERNTHQWKQFWCRLLWPGLKQANVGLSRTVGARVQPAALPETSTGPAVPAATERYGWNRCIQVRQLDAAVNWGISYSCVSNSSNAAASPATQIYKSFQTICF